jgi:ribosome-associated toxin RatA of RatAB toxin-antitoxin module
VHAVVAVLGAALATPCGGFSTLSAPGRPLARQASAGRARDLRAVLVPSPFSFPSLAARFGDANVDFSTSLVDFGLGLKSAGSLTIEAPLSVVWDIVTDYERHPEFMPNIVASKLERTGTQLVLNQRGLLSNKLQLKVDMRLAVTELFHNELRLERISGHGFMDFKARYQFAPLAGGSCRLGYEVQAVPCPIFPMPIVQHKVRKEVPRMLSALRARAIERSAPQGLPSSS